MHLIIRLLRTATVKARPHSCLLYDTAPTVDVLVPCCGEPVDVLINTVAAAAGQDYPASQFQVFVLDDAGFDDLRRAIEELNLSDRFATTIIYCSREVESDVHSYLKAGNLRFGIEETGRTLGGEFIASIDANIVPVCEWLRRMVPHLVMDTKLGMLNQPQHYYNATENDMLAEEAEFEIWYTLFETANDRVGEALCQGSGFLVRRSAIEQVGGWPLAYSGEDVMCSLMLLFAGWKLGYDREYLQHGVIPESLEARLRQKTRWAADILEFVEEYGFRLTTKTLGALAYRDLAAIPTLLGLIILPFVMLTTAHHAETISVSASQYSLIRIMLLLTFMSGKINDYVVYHIVGLGRLARYQSLNLWCAPYATMRYLQSLIPLISVSPSFFVTGTFVSPINERSSSKRAGLWKRLQSSGLPMNISYVLLSSVTMVWCLWQSISTQTSSKLSSSNSLHILMSPGPIVKLAACLWKAFMPVFYMIKPPTAPTWRDYLESDSQGALRPKAIQRIMGPYGCSRDDGITYLYWYMIETGIVLCSLWNGF